MKEVRYFCSAQENGEVADHRGAGHPAVQGCPERHPARGAQGEIRSRIQEDWLHMFEHGWCLFWGGAPLLVGVKKETKWKRKRGLWFKRWFSHIETNPHVTARPWPRPAWIETRGRYRNPRLHMAGDWPRGFSGHNHELGAGRAPAFLSEG